LAALADAQQRRPIALVLGMHRSGTSLCSQILSLLGVDMTEEIGIGAGNEAGHWERLPIVEFHDRILGMFNRGYYGPLHDLPLPPGWWAQPQITEIRREIAAYVKERLGDAPFGFKDPRTLRLLPLWHHILDDVKLAPKLVLCLRNPAQVARSLNARDGLDLRAGEYRWLVYMTDFFRHVGDVEFCTIEYEQWFSDPRANADKLAEFLVANWLVRQPDRGGSLTEVIDLSLRHDDTARPEPQEPLVREFYELARVADRDSAARERIDDLVARFAGFERLYRGFHQAFERTAPLAAALPELERQRAGLAEENARLAQEVQEATAARSALGEANRRLDEQVRAAAQRQAALETSAAEQARRFAEREGESARALAEQSTRMCETARVAAEIQAALTTRLSDHAQREVQARELAERLARAVRRGEDGRRGVEAKLVETMERLARLRAVAADREAVFSERTGEMVAAITDTEAASARHTGVVAALLGSRGRRFDRSSRAAARALGRRDWARAARHARRALALLPGSAPTWAQLGDALARRQDHDGAAAAYRRAIALDGQVAATHFRLAEVLGRQGRWADAVDSYEAGLALEPTNTVMKRDVDALYPRLVEEGDRARDARGWADAARFYWRALDRLPGLMPIWVQLGHALKEHGDYGGAEAAYRRALALDEGAADSHLQLGHLMKMQGRRRDAARAYAAALRIEPGFLAAQESLHAVLGHARVEIDELLADEIDGGTLAPASAAAVHAPQAADARLTAAVDRPAGRYDVIWLGVIDWNYRIQRPQHLARELADAGLRVFYVSITFDGADRAGRFRIIDSPHPGVCEVRLRVESDPAASIYAGLSASVVSDLWAALDELAASVGLHSPAVVVDHPAWGPVACGIPGATVVYDCLDLATGFANAAPTVASAEEWLVEQADLVVTASKPLAQHISGRRDSVIVRNAAEIAHFAAAGAPAPANPRPVIGYIGAIAEWFEIDWIERCARARPQWEFRLIGRTDGCNVAAAEALPNVRFYGERPYRELPDLLREFDAAIIPFKMNPLIECTNPVKLYEYMAAGKPVVAAPMPEVIDGTDLAYIAANADEFERRLAQALAEDSAEARARRQAWARGHDWAVRGKALAAAIDAALPPVSVVILSYNNWELTAACLDSVRRQGDYPNLQIIVVDNASTDETPKKLTAVAKEDDRIELILNDKNLGFAAGNNAGIRAARGDYVILLNNDTYVTRGWVRDLIRPLQRDPRIALSGPLTNNIGNEQKIRIAYRSMGEMEHAARAFSRSRLRRRLEVPNLAFFCVALRRRSIDEIGLLDEVYGLGFFEDDDYCQRVARAGYRMVIADDVFVHHHLSAAFDTLGAKAQEQMTRNRAIFEERWGPWRPHRYRNEPGFG
jgi:hypothetical protein